MIVLSIVALLVLISVLFYHRVNLYLSSLILLVYTAALGHRSYGHSGYYYHW